MTFCVDAEAVEGAIVKDYSSREDLSELIGVFWQMAARLEINAYIDRVSTDSNPADGPLQPDKEHLYKYLGWKEARGPWKHLLTNQGQRAWEKPKA